MGLSLSDVQAPNGPELSRNEESKPGTNSFAPFGFAEHEIDHLKQTLHIYHTLKRSVPSFSVISDIEKYLAPLNMVWR